jgi:hypothetical protein
MITKECGKNQIGILSAENVTVFTVRLAQDLRRLVIVLR